VVDRAWGVLDRLEKENRLGDYSHPDQLNLFEKSDPEPEDPVIPGLLASLSSLDLNQLTPIQALNELAKLKDRIPPSVST
jgi:hypothetical protein